MNRICACVRSHLAKVLAPETLSGGKNHPPATPRRDVTLASKTLNRAYIFIPALILILGGCGSKDPSAESTTQTPVVAVSVDTASTGTIQSTLTVTGSLSPLPNQEVMVSPLAPGRISKVFVSTGDRVSKGQTIAALDPGPAAGQLRQAQAGVLTAEATLTQARVNLQSQLRTHTQDLRQAQLNVQAQQVALAKLKAGSRPQEIAQAQASVVAAQASLTNAQQNLARSQTLASQGLLARKDLEAAQALQVTAKASLAGAKEALSMAKQGSRPEDITAGEVALAQARQQLSAVRSQDILTRSKEEDVRIAQGQVQSAQGLLDSALAQTRSLSITSPVAGTVTGRTVNPGESVDVTTAIATIVNLNRVRLLLNVPSDQISEVAQGQQVQFTTDSDPAHVRTARVSVISTATDPNSNTVQVEAIAENADGSLRDDGFVKATIITQIHRNAVLIPAGAVVVKDDKSSVFLAGGDGLAHLKQIKIGAREGDRVQVLSGVSPGDKLVTTGAFELDEGTKIKVAQ